MSKLRGWMLSALLLALLGGCAEEPPKVARLVVEAPPDSELADSELVDSELGDFGLADFELGYPEAREVRLRWDPMTELTANLDADPHVFVHLLDSQARLVRTFDHPLPSPWIVGEEIAYDLVLSQSAMAPPLGAGLYDLVAGLYNPTDGERWSLETAGEETGRQAYRLMQVRVPEAELGNPQLEYRGAWAPVAAGSDQQILASRWMRGEGDIHLPEVGELGGQLSLRLWLPAAEDASQQIQFSGEDSTQRLRIVSSCGGSQVEVSEPGLHRVTLAIDPSKAAVVDPSAEGEAVIPSPEPVDETGCTVTLRPNFRLVTQGDPQPLAVRLQGVYWREGLDSSPAADALAVDESVPRVP